MTAPSQESPDAPPPPRGSAREVFFTFLRLGCTSFGGPIAHLGYFQRELVERRKWCSSNTLAEIIALAQSLPGPASSQVGFALGILRAGLRGGLAAWLGFALPSTVLMLAFALAAQSWASTLSVQPWQGALHGLQLVAVAVIAQAILSMRKSLAPDLIRVTFTLLAAAFVLFAPVSSATLIAIAIAAIAGLLLFQNRPQPAFEPLPRLLSKRTGIAAASLFVAALLLSAVALLIPAAQPGPFAVFSAFYRAGALVFGGGHVVLPLLQNTVVAPGWVTLQSFLSGYGAAQALPGPLFSFAAYLGALTHPAASPSVSPILYGLLALIGLFAPGLLAIVAVLPFWSTLRANRRVRAALLGVNAAVLGILLAALIHPLWTTTIHTAVDLVVAAFAFALLTRFKAPAWLVVLVIATLEAAIRFPMHA